MLDRTREPSSPCPDETELAAYIDGRLAPRLRERVEAHLAECEECSEISTETTRMERGGRQGPLRWTSGRIAAIGGLVAVILGLAYCAAASVASFW